MTLVGKEAQVYTTWEKNGRLEEGRRKMTVINLGKLWVLIRTVSKLMCP